MSAPNNVLDGNNDEMEYLSIKMVNPTNRVSLQRKSSLFGLSNNSSAKCKNLFFFIYFYKPYTYRFHLSAPPTKSFKSNYGEQLAAEAKQWHRLVKNLLRHNAR